MNLVENTPLGNGSDVFWMHKALEYALEGWRLPRPNPCVGALAVREGQLLGSARSGPKGGPHAEAQLIAQLGEQCRGATLYVTLEPCSHYGKNPPCAPAVVSAGFARVVVACLDPNPLVAGRGLQCLQEAGVPVSFGVLEAEAQEIYSGFFHWVRTGRSQLWLKCAMDLDRVCCAVDGPLPITDAQSRAWTHSVRGVSDAVLVGGRTLRLDDPSLNVREPQPTTDQPVPVILTRDPATLPLQAKIWDLHRKVWILSAQNMRGLPAHAEAIPWDGVEEISVALGRVGLHRVLAETGPELWSQALLEWNWDRAYLLRACRRLGTGKAAAKVFASGGTLARFAWTGHDWLSEYRKEAPCSQA